MGIAYSTLKQQNNPITKAYTSKVQRQHFGGGIPAFKSGSSRKRNDETSETDGSESKTTITSISRDDAAAGASGRGAGGRAPPAGTGGRAPPAGAGGAHLDGTFFKNVQERVPCSSNQRVKKVKEFDALEIRFDMVEKTIRIKREMGRKRDKVKKEKNPGRTNIGIRATRGHPSATSLPARSDEYLGRKYDRLERATGYWE
ncbi:hypothetical protein EVAR_14481_1 [Eumeta japonica]|uniref:Uncharacterized protein n=1 Tax=Eumeta variegata TaxID=151549 RepID=A0A4C1U308_EUMVA|nr:hypothetical protein EVAR_14481_1 [Eumeta japonica]